MGQTIDELLNFYYDPAGIYGSLENPKGLKEEDYNIWFSSEDLCWHWLRKGLENEEIRNDPDFIEQVLNKNI